MKVRLTALALAALLVSPPGSARAQSTAEAAGYLYLTSSTAVSGGLLVGGIVIIATNGSKPNPDPSMKILGGVMIAGGLLSTGASALYTSLVAEAIAMYGSRVDRLDAEVAAGQGPQLDALATTLGVTRAGLIAAYRTARAEQPEVKSNADAERLLARTLHQLGPQLQVSEPLIADFLWQLEQERTAHDFPARATGHQLLATWLGVPTDVAVKAVKETFDGYLASRANAGEVQSARALLRQQPRALVDQLGARIVTGNEALVKQRLRALCAAGAQIDPALARQTLARYGL